MPEVDWVHVCPPDEDPPPTSVLTGLSLWQESGTRSGARIDRLKGFGNRTTTPLWDKNLYELHLSLLESKIDQEGSMDCESECQLSHARIS